MLYATTGRLLGLFLFMAFSANLFSQVQMTEVKDSELEKFIEVQEMIAVTQQNVQPMMIEIIEENNFEIPRFIELTQAIENNQEVEATEAELERFDETQKAIDHLQTEANTEIAEGIEEIGLTLDRYQEIMMALQQSPELQNRIQDLR
jgi:hypothetical protein